MTETQSINSTTLIYSELYPELGTGPVSTTPYVSPTYFEQERETIFRRCWLLVGREEELPNPHDFIVRPVEAAQASVIISRGADSEIRAFHNVCAHRGNVVCKEQGSGHARRFTCDYHGWAYDSGGDLAFVPDEALIPGLVKSASGLTPISCALWEGFIFINFDPSPEMSLGEYLGDFNSQYEGFFTGLEPVGGLTATVSCNWKTFLHAFLETYHFHKIHRRIFTDIAGGKDDPLGHILDAQLHERHSVVSTFANPLHQPTPTEILAWKHGAGLHTARGLSRELPPGVNSNKHENWNSDITVLFPHVALNVIGDFILPVWSWPIDHKTTRCVARLYMPKAKNAGEKLSQSYLVAQTRQGLREDLDNLEYVQAGTDTGGKTEMLLHDREIAIRHHLSVVAGYVGE